MEGGIAILLLVIIVVVGGGIALALYLTGGAISMSGRRKQHTDEPRPEHREVSSPTLENTRFAGTPSGETAEHEPQPEHERQH
jgi:hypothetical protein